MSEINPDNAVTYIDPESGDEVECELPHKFVVCPRCQGHGKHLNPSIGQHAYTPEEFVREFDEEERKAYFTRGGMYDVTCERCLGNNVISVIDQEACTTPEQQAHLKAYLADQADLAQERAEERYIQRMESGGWAD